MDPTEQLKADLKDLVPYEAIEILEKFFQDKMPPQCDSLEQIRYRQGQVSVVRFLKEL